MFQFSLPMDTQVGIGVIIAACLFVHLLFFDATKFQAPSFFTTTGIFFTFWGIASGLLDFDVANVQGSLPKLLGGLKTAFLASLIGVGAALTVKFRIALTAILHKKAASPHPHGASMDDLAGHLMAVQRALVGQDESALITQLKLGRQESNDRMDGLRRVLEDFTRTQSENNSKALIEALKDVMRDFNAKINEQFGENFKHLNQAVSDILVWQERYRQQMGELISQQEINTQSLKGAALHLTSVVEQAGHYSQTARDLSALLQGIEGQRLALQDSMSALGQLFAATSQRLPEIEQRVADYALQMTKASAEANAAMTASMDQAITAAAAQLTALGQALRAGETAIADGARALLEASRKANTDLVQAAQTHADQQRAALIDGQKALHDGVRAANEGLNSQIQDMVSKTKEQVTTLDVALQTELTNSLNTLGRQLTALSQQFVSDYGPLTERLRDLVAVGGRV